jgi:hypothetical protein
MSSSCRRCRRGINEKVILPLRWAPPGRISWWRGEPGTTTPTCGSLLPLKPQPQGDKPDTETDSSARACHTPCSSPPRPSTRFSPRAPRPAPPRRRSLQQNHAAVRLIPAVAARAQPAAVASRLLPFQVRTFSVCESRSLS